MVIVIGGVRIPKLDHLAACPSAYGLHALLVVEDFAEVITVVLVVVLAVVFAVVFTELVGKGFAMTKGLGNESFGFGITFASTPNSFRILQGVS